MDARKPGHRAPPLCPGGGHFAGGTHLPRRPSLCDGRVLTRPDAHGRRSHGGTRLGPPLPWRPAVSFTHPTRTRRAVLKGRRDLGTSPPPGPSGAAEDQSVARFRCHSPEGLGILLLSRAHVGSSASRGPTCRPTGWRGRRTGGSSGPRARSPPSRAQDHSLGIHSHAGRVCLPARRRCV